jgi:hypothetical protein
MPFPTPNCLATVAGGTPSKKPAKENFQLPGSRTDRIIVTEEAKQFFFEKKNQKTFVIWRTPPDRTATAK